MQVFHVMINRRDAVMYAQSYPYFLVALLSIILAGCSSVGANMGITKQASKEEQRDSLQTMKKDTLVKLYELQPGAKKVIDKSAGYAVFTNFGMKLFVAGAGRGWGIATDSSNNKDTYMQMVELQAGLGFGVKTFQLVWVFEKPALLNRFIDSGWEMSAQTTAAVQIQEQGGYIAGAIAIEPGVWLYQIIDQGLALELTLKGSKYYKDANLN
ncbi:MAG: hypothetical protein AAF512_07635 [Pseudomonadota bacterium]